MNMLGKDPKRFSKIQAFHDKHGKLAALNKADADADDVSENPTDADDDDDDELEETARDDSTKTVTTKTGTTKKSAPKKTTTTVKQSATTTPASPTLQNGVITKITKIIKGRKQGDRRPHRSVDYGYWSAPSDSEYEEKRRSATTLSGRMLKLVKLKETIDRHAAWCPFVHLNKKLHHAHRRIRALQHRPNNEPELPKTLDELAKRGHDNDDHDDDHIEKEETNGEDEDDSDSMEEIIIKVPRKRKTQFMAAFEKKSAQVEQLAPPNDDEPKQPTGSESLPGNEHDSTSIVDATAGATDQNSSLTKATRSKDEALSRTSRAQSSFPDSDIAVPGKNDVDHQENSHAALSTTPDDHKFKQLIRAVNAVPQPSVELDETARAGAAKKRKASLTEPNADAEPVSKTRKIRAD